MIFDIAIISGFWAFSFYSSKALRSVSSTFEKFNQSLILSYLVFLVPIAIILKAGLTLLTPSAYVLPFLIPFIIYLAILILTIKQKNSFEKIRNDQIIVIINELKVILYAGLIGLVYTMTTLVYSILIHTK